jgi:hypothetical protein
VWCATPLLEHPLGVEHLLGLDRDVGRRAADAAGRLVHHDPRVRQGVPLALGAGAQQELAHRGGHAHRDGGHVVVDELHRVVDGHARVDGAAGRVDVEDDVALRILGREEQQLSADPVGHLVVHLATEDDDAVLEQAVVYRVVEVEPIVGTARDRRGRNMQVGHGSPSHEVVDMPTVTARPVTNRRCRRFSLRAYGARRTPPALSVQSWS